MSVVLVVIIRSLIAYIALFLFVRLIGKQQISQLTYFDYIIGITIGSTASTLSVQVNENTLSSLTGMGVWTLLAIIMAIINIRSKKIRQVIEGTAELLIKNGCLQNRIMKKNKLTVDDLMSLLRNQGVFNIEEVENAIFETNGKLSVQLKSSKQPLTPEDLNIQTSYKGISTNLITDGKLSEEKLYKNNLSKAWLMTQLKKQDITKISDIFLCQLDTKGNLYIDMKNIDKYYIIDTNQ